MLIRDAQDAELDEVAGLMVAAYREYAPLMPETAWREYAQDIEAVRSRLGNSRLVICRAGGRLAGAVTFYPPGSGPWWPREWAGFRLLAVDPDHRRGGVARALVADVIARARAAGAEAVGIHTTPWMSAAMALYEAIGFVRDRRFDFEPGITLPDGSQARVDCYRLDLPAR
ncbi:MAG: GNAT family N-acetyltransferase [Solirubrobacteraceae bacterium]